MPGVQNLKTKRGVYADQNYVRRSGGEYPNFEGPAQKRITYTATEWQIAVNPNWSIDFRNDNIRGA